MGGTGMNADKLRAEIADLSAERSQRIAALEAQLAALTAERDDLKKQLRGSVHIGSVECLAMLEAFGYGKDERFGNTVTGMVQEVLCKMGELRDSLTAERDAALRKLVVAREAMEKAVNVRHFVHMDGSKFITDALESTKPTP